MKNSKKARNKAYRNEGKKLAIYERVSYDLIDGRAVFSGGKYGDHSVSYDGPADLRRVWKHWNGYCAAQK